MMTSDGARAVLERFYAAESAYVAAGGPGRAGFAEIAACLHPQVVLHQAPGLPFTGEWRGAEGMERFMGVMTELWQSVEFLEQRHLVDDERIVVVNEVRFVARASGRKLDTSLVQMMTVRSGLLFEIRPYYWDPAAVSEVLTPG
ncbi:nuclear transport factor 2 family protein [Streptomyces sp. NBC_00442]|uniref:nuclear transport factor 2 family protein n=1 Tax=Streptomyces sp. NBC_00442 TaxID=2903651 RepID=UPI002E1C717A